MFFFFFFSSSSFFHNFVSGFVFFIFFFSSLNMICITVDIFIFIILGVLWPFCICDLLSLILEHFQPIFTSNISSASFFLCSLYIPIMHIFTHCEKLSHVSSTQFWVSLNLLLFDIGLWSFWWHIFKHTFFLVLCLVHEWFYKDIFVTAFLFSSFSFWFFLRDANPLLALFTCFSALPTFFIQSS